MPHRLLVNGQERSADVLDDTPLLWVLRDALDLVGTKYGCGIGQCGACTVHLDGAPVRSCQLPVSAVGQRAVTTIEGLASAGGHAPPQQGHGDADLHPVQQAWMRLDVPQCGYCQAGQIMAAAALLRHTPQPSDADIDAALGGHLCRCGAYLRIRAAVHLAAQIATQPSTAATPQPGPP
ncbi:MAG: (2Fe-2S)-binding protein [Proteobacteria bacterium]|uniref:(2Fe-2S)-binding protein n=1 Tax=Aquabacterium sp. TaxID=1872578 RepID=UPI0035C6C6EE|nr:(2Fe-2S)-binding protein [Pseudomonadota bacterium]